MAGLPPTEWAGYDAAFVASTLVLGELVTSSHLEDCVQLRVRRRFRAFPAALYAAVAVAAGFTLPLAGMAVVAFAAAEAVRGWWRCGPRVRRIVRGATHE